MHDFLPNAAPLSAAELDHRLEKAVQDQERAEKLICFYLYQIKRRGHYRVFGFENVYDYAMERFSFCHSKTRTAPVPCAQAHSVTAAHRSARRRQDRLDQSSESRIAGDSRDRRGVDRKSREQLLPRSRAPDP